MKKLILFSIAFMLFFATVKAQVINDTTNLVTIKDTTFANDARLNYMAGTIIPAVVKFVDDYNRQVEFNGDSLTYKAETNNTINTPSGWILLNKNTTSPNGGMAMFYKQATGEEYGGSIVVDIANSGSGIFYGAIFRYKNASTLTVENSCSLFNYDTSININYTTYPVGQLAIHFFVFTGTGYNNTTIGSAVPFPYFDEVSSASEGGGKILMEYGCNGGYQGTFETTPSTSVRYANGRVVIIN